jgi:hypothetical protein
MKSLKLLFRAYPDEWEIECHERGGGGF